MYTEPTIITTIILPPPFKGVDFCLEQISRKTNWILGLPPDWYVSSFLELTESLPPMYSSVNGIRCFESSWYWKSFLSEISYGRFKCILHNLDRISESFLQAGLDYMSCNEYKNSAPKHSVWTLEHQLQSLYCCLRGDHCWGFSGRAGKFLAVVAHTLWAFGILYHRFIELTAGGTVDLTW